MSRALLRSSCVVIVLGASVTGCGFGNTDTNDNNSGVSDSASVSAPSGSFTVGGTITGLVGSGLVLTDNGGDTLTVSSGATTFTFATAVATGHTFDVAVTSQPNGAGENCTVAQNSGTISGKVTTVAVTCTTPSYRLSGTVTGLSGTGLKLTDAHGGTLSVSSAGAFTLPTAVRDGLSYSVTVATDPTTPPQGCTVSNGSGVVSGSNVTTVAVVCNNATEELLITDTVANVVAYLIDPQSGSLAPTRAPVSLGSGRSYLVADPTGAVVYLSPVAGTSIGAYSISAVTGAPTPISGSPFAVGAAPGPLVIDASGKYLYTATPAGLYAFTRDPTTGALGPIAGSPFVIPTPGQFDGFTAATSGFLYYFLYTSGNQYQLGGFAINPATGALSASGGSSSEFQSPYGFGAVNAAGTVFAFTSGGVQSFTIDPTSGALTLASPVAAGSPSTVTNLVMNPAGTYAYATDGAIVEAFAVNATTGVLTATAESPFPTNAVQDVNVTGSSLIVFDQTGQFLYVGNRAANRIFGFAVDPTSGALTALPGSPYATSLSLYTLLSATIP